MGKINAWSYSRWSTYDECPQRARFVYIDKLPEPGSQAMERGSQIHKTLERYVQDSNAMCEIPHEFGRLRGMARVYKVRGAKPEVQVAFNRAWQRVDWFSPDVYVRGIFDLVVVDNGQAVVIDYKTGKYRDSHEEQGELFALLAFLAYPATSSVRVEFWYVDAKPDERCRTERVYKRVDWLDRLKEKWQRRGDEMTTAEDFPARPGQACRWCHFRAANGGQCRH